MESLTKKYRNRVPNPTGEGMDCSFLMMGYYECLRKNEYYATRCSSQFDAYDECTKNQVRSVSFFFYVRLTRRKRKEKEKG